MRVDAPKVDEVDVLFEQRRQVKQLPSIIEWDAGTMAACIDLQEHIPTKLL
jgi:hypothetical protein